MTWRAGERGLERAQEGEGDLGGGPCTKGWSAGKPVTWRAGERRLEYGQEVEGWRGGSATYLVCVVVWGKSEAQTEKERDLETRAKCWRGGRKLVGMVRRT